MLGVEGAAPGGTTIGGEVQLACAVLEAALSDLQSKHHDNEARLFCLRDFGAWARKRAFWCDIAGIDEPAFVAAAQRISTTVV